MTFEQWQTRPVYVVQCYTSMIARTVSVCTEERLFHFRCLPAATSNSSRFDPAEVERIRRRGRARSQMLRDATAAKLREMRARLGLTGAICREWYEKEVLRGDRRGIAIRCDLSELLTA